MKNNLYKILCFGLVLLTISSCEKDRRFAEFETLEYGAIPRVIEGINYTGGDGAWNFDAIDESSLSFTVEMFDENNGANVESYVWTAAYRGFGPTQIASYSKSDFSAGALGLPTLSVNWSMTEIMDALGVVSDSLFFGNNFDLQATLTKTDGSVFTSANTEGNVQGQPLFRGLFQIPVGIDNAPAEGAFKSDLGGVMSCITTVTSQSAGIGWDDCAGNIWEGEVEWIQEHTIVDGPGQYNVTTVEPGGNTWVDLSMGAYYGCYASDAEANLPGGDLKIADEDGKLSWSGASQWDEVYTFTALTTDGPVLSFAWTNNYGEGASSDLTRTDGKDWPNLSF